MPTAGGSEPRALLARSGLRATRQRLRVLEVLTRERDDATAQEIHARLRGRGEPIGLATVYRTLGLLSERSVIHALPHRPAEMCYRLCRDEHHHHLVCSSCHHVVEVEGCPLEGWVGPVASAHGFLPTEHRLELTGLCGDCRAPGRSGTPPASGRGGRFRPSPEEPDEPSGDHRDAH